MFNVDGHIQAIFYTLYDITCCIQNEKSNLKVMTVPFHCIAFRYV